jgi:hypothetical protein
LGWRGCVCCTATARAALKPVGPPGQAPIHKHAVRASEIFR